MSRHKHRSKISDRYENNPMKINPDLLKVLGLDEINNENISQIMSSLREENFNIDSMNNILKTLNTKNNDGVNYKKSENINNSQNISNLANMLAGSMQANQGNNNIGNILANLMSGEIDPSILLKNMGMNFNSFTNEAKENINNTKSGVNSNINNDSFKDNKNNSKMNIRNTLYDEMNCNKVNNRVNTYDDKVRMLESLKNFVDEDKIRFLNKVIDMYKKGEIIYK